MDFIGDVDFTVRSLRALFCVMAVLCSFSCCHTAQPEATLSLAATAAAAIVHKALKKARRHPQHPPIGSGSTLPSRELLMSLPTPCRLELWCLLVAGEPRL